MMLSNFSCHVTPLHKNLNVLNSAIHKFTPAKFMHKLQHGALPKICKVSFEVSLVVIVAKPDLLATKIISYKGFLQILENRLFFLEGLHSGQK